MATKRRHRGSASTRSEVHIRKNPSTKLPVTLTARVPSGTPAGAHFERHWETKYRRFAPKTAPIEIKRTVCEFAGILRLPSSVFGRSHQPLSQRAVKANSIAAP